MKRVALPLLVLPLLLAGCDDPASPPPAAIQVEVDNAAEYNLPPDAWCGGGDGLARLSLSETQQWLARLRDSDPNEDPFADAGSPQQSAAAMRAVRDLILYHCRGPY